MLDEIITGEEYCAGDPVELQGATYKVVGMKIGYDGKVQLHLRRLTPDAADKAIPPHQCDHTHRMYCSVCGKPPF